MADEAACACKYKFHFDMSIRNLFICVECDIYCTLINNASKK